MPAEVRLIFHKRETMASIAKMCPSAKLSPKGSPVCVSSQPITEKFRWKSMIRLLFGWKTWQQVVSRLVWCSVAKEIEVTLQSTGLLSKVPIRSLRWIGQFYLIYDWKSTEISPGKISKETWGLHYMKESCLRLILSHLICRGLSYLSKMDYPPLHSLRGFVVLILHHFYKFTQIPQILNCFQESKC